MGLELDRRQALDLWRDVTVMTVRDEEADLTSRQLAVLMTVYLLPGPHTVRGMAATLNLGKPAVTRAIDALERYRLAVRAPDPDDARSVLVARTPQGQAYLSKFADMISERAAQLDQHVSLPKTGPV
ncbi:MAG: MarR family winged helix-turn-helix transcriptional regulator [Caulobacterales bacterium]|jgi:DNA-binding MarR family transcriptional regulator